MAYLKKDYNIRCKACVWYDSCREGFSGQPPDLSDLEYVKELSCFHRA